MVITLGYHQKAIPSHWEKLLEDGVIKIVRRPSGGGAVLHSGGITYALTFKKSSYPMTGLLFFLFYLALTLSIWPFSQLLLTYVTFTFLAKAPAQSRSRPVVYN